MEVRKIKNSDRWSFSQLLYAVLFGAMIIGFLVIQAYDHESFVYPLPLAIIRLSVTVMGIIIGKLWKDKGFLIMAALLIWQMIRVLFKDPGLLFTDAVSVNLLNGIWIVGGCYAIGRILTIKQLKQFFRVIIPVWTFGSVIHCLITLYAAWTDQGIINLYGVGPWVGGAMWGITWNGRLCVGYAYPSTAGSALSISCVISLIALIVEKKKPIRLFYSFSLLIMMLVLGLTDARTSVISFSVGVGFVAFSLVLWKHYHRTEENNRIITEKRKIRIWAGAAACLLIATCLTMIISFQTVPLFNAVKTRGSVILAEAKAEEETTEEKQMVASRGLTGNDTLSGRGELWKSVIRYLVNKPERLVFGVSVYNPTDEINRDMGWTEVPFAHCHNMPLQILLESGVIGFALVVLFGIHTAKNGYKMMRNPRVSLWMYLIPAAMVSILTGDLAECFSWFRAWQGVAMVFLFIAAGMINSFSRENAEQA